MKRNIYDCWKCRHHNIDNPYGIDYCEVHDTRCYFVHNDCDNFEPDTDGTDRHPEPPCRLTVIGWYLLTITLAVLIGWMLMGCTTTKYVSVVDHRTDTLMCYSSIWDSIYVHDSIHVHEKSDTVTIERWHTRWRDRWQHDTLYISKTDSVPQPYPVEVVKEVDKPLTWWQKTRMFVGGMVIFGLIIFAAVKIFWRK